MHINIGWTSETGYLTNFIVVRLVNYKTLLSKKKPSLQRLFYSILYFFLNTWQWMSIVKVIYCIFHKHIIYSIEVEELITCPQQKLLTYVTPISYMVSYLYPIHICNRYISYWHINIRIVSFVTCIVLKITVSLYFLLYLIWYLWPYLYLCNIPPHILSLLVFLWGLFLFWA